MTNGLHPVPYPVARLKKLRFTGPKRVRWTKKKWLAKNAAYYTPTFEIDRTLPADVTIRVQVREDIRPGADPRLGRFDVVFPKGKKKGIVITTNNKIARSRGFPAKTKGRFWLVATRAGRIRGNLTRGDDGHANVYLRTTRNGYACRKGKIVAAIIATGRGTTSLRSKSKSVRRKKV